MGQTKATAKAASNKGFLGNVKSIFGKSVTSVTSIVPKVAKTGVLGVAGFAGLAVYNLLHKESTKTKQVKNQGTAGIQGPVGGPLGFPSGFEVTPPKLAPYKGKYTYNAPMVKNAYFNPLPSLTRDDGLYGSVNLEWYTHAANAWRKGDAAKGAIQMDRYLWNQKTVIDLLTAAEKKRGKKLPRDMRGFRFLYNPELVNMSWGVNSYSNNQALLMGIDSINPIAPSTSASMVSFSLFLNRIEDMTFIDSEGNFKISDYNYTDAIFRYGANSRGEYVDTTTLAGIAKASAVTPKPIIYPQNVSQNERKLIYQKGTMYDVEWLLSTLNGFAFRDFVSELNGATNDMGFLMQFPVELHLGNTMRYRVQVTDISIQHIIFNTRMVPIWSKVNLSCRRMPSYNLGGDNSLTLGK